MPALIDLTGRRFGRLTVVARGTNGARGEVRWFCSCECGGTTESRGSDLTRGDTQSCRCLNRELTSRCNFRHGQAGQTPEYACWINIIQRCENVGNDDYHNYGGRGINICDEWRHDFAAFCAHVGPKPSPEFSLDRIDNDGDYKPGNVRWATKAEQNHNRRTVTTSYDAGCVDGYHAGHADGYADGYVAGRVDEAKVDAAEVA